MAMTLSWLCSQPAFKWDGVNHCLYFVRHQKQHGTLHKKNWTYRHHSNHTHSNTIVCWKISNSHEWSESTATHSQSYLKYAWMISLHSDKPCQRRSWPISPRQSYLEYTPFSCHHVQWMTPMMNPILIKKLQQGDGQWDTQKEILGWLFDGITKCMKLPMER